MGPSKYCLDEVGPDATQQCQSNIVRLHRGERQQKGMALFNRRFCSYRQPRFNISQTSTTQALHIHEKFALCGVGDVRDVGQLDVDPVDGRRSLDGGESRLADVGQLMVYLLRVKRVQ